jgi:hypothetical protein
MNRRLPTLAIALGVLGLIPFIGCALATLSLAGTQSDQFFWALLAYGGVILAFMGGVHWGFALGDEAGRGERPRMLVAIVPPLVAWVALFLPVVLPRISGLIALIAGFIAAIAIDLQMRRRGLMPPGYLWLRWALTVVVIAILTTVVVLRLAGAQIVL